VWLNIMLRRSRQLVFLEYLRRSNLAISSPLKSSFIKQQLSAVMCGQVEAQTSSTFQIHYSIPQSANNPVSGQDRPSLRPLGD